MSDSRVFAVIPARFESTRFPGKPLALIKNKPMIEWVIEGVRQCQGIDQILVATDHQQIFDAVTKLRVTAIMTPSDLASGTDRIYQAVKDFAKEGDIIINVQGDEPLIQGKVLDLLIESLLSQELADMATLVGSIDSTSELENPNIVKVLVDDQEQAIYFSRFPIPYSRQSLPDESVFICKRHIGIYGFRFAFLQQFCGKSVTPLERAESLEQLRALQMGAKILVKQTTFKGHGVDVPEDIAIIERYLDYGI